MTKAGLRTKLLLFTITPIVIMAGLSIFYSLYATRRGIEKEIGELRVSRMETIKTNLRYHMETVYSVVQGRYEQLSKKTYLVSKYNRKLKAHLGAVETTIDLQKALVAEGILSLRSAQQRAIRAIEGMRYDDGIGYVWINDTGLPIPSMIMHPTLPDLNGTVLDDPKYNVADGTDKNLFQAFVEICLQKGEGWVQYVGPKPTNEGLTSGQPKLGYALLIEEWNWIIGTEIYLEDAMADEMSEILEMLKIMKYNEGEGYFWINDLGKPYPTMIMHPTIPSLDGVVLSDSSYNVVEGTGQNLFQAFVEVTEESGSGFVNHLWPKPTKGGLTENMQKISYVRRFEPLDWIIGTGIYTDEFDAALEKEEKILRENLNYNPAVVIGGFALLTLISGILNWFLSRSIAKPVKRMTLLLKNLSEEGGDLTARINDDTKDEFGVMARLHNSFMDKLEQMVEKLQQISNKNIRSTAILNDQIDLSDQSIKDIRSHSNNLDEQVNELNDIIGLSHQSLVAITKHLEGISNRIKEQTTAIQQSSRASEEITANICSISKLNQQRKSWADEMLSLTKDGGEKVHDTARIIQKVADNADKMHDLITVVKSIASQTNLLAMNAAIEAAHAGEAGKGFAVVADEIRKLAETTGQNAAEISNNLQNVLDDIEEALNVSKLSGRAFISLEKEVGETHSSFSEITSNMSKLTVTSEEMVQVMGRISGNSEAISQDSQNIRVEIEKAYELTTSVHQLYQRSMVFSQSSSGSHIERP